MAELRLLDAGRVGALRSQALWHGIAAAMAEEAAPTLSLCTSVEPYVGLGYHRRLDDVDHEACRALGLPIVRRQIGGGAVWVDADQLLFQLTLPARRAPQRVDRLYRELLRPAVAAFRELGLPARLSGVNDIAVEDRKVSGTGAGRIGQAVTVVGNIIFRFPHERMVQVLALPSAGARRECLALMRRYVSSLAGEGAARVSRERARRALVAAYGEALGLAVRPASLSPAEERAVRDFERRFADPRWLAGPPVPPASRRQVKISAEAWVSLVEDGDLAVEATVAGGRLERVALAGSRLNGTARAMGRALAGQPATPAALASCLDGFGEPGRRVAALLAPALELRG